jgi:hypothetical protein
MRNRKPSFVRNAFCNTEGMSVANAFCPTGKGGEVDATCPPANKGNGIPLPPKGMRRPAPRQAGPVRAPNKPAASAPAKGQAKPTPKPASKPQSSYAHAPKGQTNKPTQPTAKGTPTPNTARTLALANALVKQALQGKAKAEDVARALMQLDSKSLGTLRAKLGLKGNPTRAEVAKKAAGKAIEGAWQKLHKQAIAEAQPKPTEASGKAPPQPPKQEPTTKDTKTPKLELKFKDSNHPIAKRIAEDKETQRIMQEVLNYKPSAEYVKMYQQEQERAQLITQKQTLKLKNDKAGIEAINKRLDEIATDKDYFERQAILRKGEQDARDHFSNLMRHPEPVKVDTPNQMLSRGKDGDHVAKGAQWVLSMTGGTLLHDRLDIRDEPRNRSNYAYASPANGYKPALKMGKGTPEYLERSAAHETGHHIEMTKAGLGGLARDFLKYRVGDEKLTDLGKAMRSTSMNGEQGRKDDFEKAFGERAWYVGKHYSDGKGGVFSTEIISMGVERLHQNAKSFIQQDPEYAAFVIHALRSK